MASVSQSPWLYTVRPTNFALSSTKSKPRGLLYKTLKVSSSSSSDSQPSPPNSSNPPDSSSAAEARAKLSLAKAKAYKEAVKSNQTPKIVQNPVSEYTDTGSGNGGSNEEFPLSVRILMEKAKEYEIKEDVYVGGEGIAEKSEEAFSGLQGGDGLEKIVSKKEDPNISSIDFIGLDFTDKKKSRGLPADPSQEGDFPEAEILVADPSKFGTSTVSQPKSTENDNPVVYEPKVSTWGTSSKTTEDDPDLYEPKVSTRGGSPSHENISKTEGDFPEVEILVGDPSKFGPRRVSQPKSAEEENPVVYNPKGSTRGASPSPRNISEAEGNFPEVEILVGDPSKFGAVRGSHPKPAKEGDPNIYEPKVSTWGGSPSHENISKAEGDFPEVEILVGDPNKFGSTLVSESKSIEEDDPDVYEPKHSRWEASHGTGNISKTEGDFPEVEILVGDPSKFGAVRGSNPKTADEDNPDVFKPKVSKWEGSPSDRNISKTEGEYPEVEILVGDPSKFGSTTVSESKSIEEDDPDVYEPKHSTWEASHGTGKISKTKGDFPDVEILVGDPSRCSKPKVSEPKTAEEDDSEVYKPNVLTLGASPSPSNISKTKRDFPEAGIVVGSPSKFGTLTLSEPKTTEEDDPDIYIPKVSSWGAFPRPRNFSKAFGGGRNIRPGEVLETAEVQAAKDARTRELAAAYLRERDSTIDPKLKSECEKALKEGDSLMDIGKLKEALPFYEAVMDKLKFQTELHGLAGLHWAICQDSLARHKEARIMYERLKSHSNVNVKRTARHFSFSFQAMAMMNVKSTTLAPINLGYKNYFEAFSEYKANYSRKDAEVEEGALNQVLPYMVFLVSPIFMVLLIALQKRI